MTTRIKRNNTVQKVWTWFEWNQCQNCKKEFRREHGYSSYVTPPRNSIINTRYLCSNCGSSLENANRMFENMRVNFRNFKPKTVVPPKRKY